MLSIDWTNFLYSNASKESNSKTMSAQGQRQRIGSGGGGGGGANINLNPKLYLHPFSHSGDVIAPSTKYGPGNKTYFVSPVPLWAILPRPPPPHLAK